MALGLLTAALKTVGGGDIAGKLLGAGGNAILNKVSEKYGLDMSSPTFDADAAAAMLADKQEANKLLLEMRAHEVEAYKTSVQDTQHARNAAINARELMSIEHRQRVDMINLYESIAMSIGGLFLVVGALGGLVYMTTIKEISIPEWLQVLIVATITWLTKDLISQRSSFKWGSSEGSKAKSTQIADEEKRDDAIEEKKIVHQVPVQRPVYTPEPTPAAPVEPVAAPAPEPVNTADVHEAVSTKRPSDGDNIF